MLRISLFLLMPRNFPPVMNYLEDSSAGEPTSTKNALNTPENMNNQHDYNQNKTLHFHALI